MIPTGGNAVPLGTRYEAPDDSGYEAHDDFGYEAPDDFGYEVYPSAIRWVPSSLAS